MLEEGGMESGIKLIILCCLLTFAAVINALCSKNVTSKKEAKDLLLFCIIFTLIMCGLYGTSVFLRHFL